MPRGGRRPGAGRKPGSLNKRTIEAVKHMGPVGERANRRAGWSAQWKTARCRGRAASRLLRSWLIVHSGALRSRSALR
jgi:hypothetical protein